MSNGLKRTISVVAGADQEADAPAEAVHDSVSALVYQFSVSYAFLRHTFAYQLPLPAVFAYIPAICFQGKRSKGSATHAMFQAPRQGDTAAVIPEVLGMDYNYKLDARHHRPINNDAPLEDLAKKP